MHYYPDEPSSSQFVPEDEEYAQRAAMDEDDRKLAKLNSRLDEEDGDYTASSQSQSQSQYSQSQSQYSQSQSEAQYSQSQSQSQYSQSQYSQSQSQSQSEDYIFADNEEQSQDDDSNTEGPQSPRRQSQSDSDAYGEPDDGMDIESDGSQSEDFGLPHMPRTITAQLLDEWRDIGRRMKKTDGKMNIDRKYAIRLAFERIYGLSAMESYVIEEIFLDEDVYEKGYLSMTELYKIVKEQWGITFDHRKV